MPYDASRTGPKSHSARSSGSVVGTPVTTYSSIARAKRASASSRLRAVTISLAIIES